jgi:hypothetical protein
MPWPTATASTSGPVVEKIARLSGFADEVAPTARTFG